MDISDSSAGAPLNRVESAEHPAAAVPAANIPLPPVYQAPFAPETPAAHVEHQSFWLWVMCLTGVDYFSTLGYQPSIAFEAAGLLAPFATVVLVLVTLFGALPVYRYVASRSPHGMGSISMLENLVHGWTGKIIVLVLLGFAATDFVITKTLSAADAAEHILHNPAWQNLPAGIRAMGEDRERMLLTVFLLIGLAASFLRGFREVIGLAVVIVFSYLVLNSIVIGAGLLHLSSHPHLIADWFTSLEAGNWHIQHAPPLSGKGWGVILALSLLYFPKLALGLSGFETGVALMPLIGTRKHRGVQEDLTDRISNTRKLLITAATIMSFYLLGSSLVTATLIPPTALEHGGLAAHRALAYLAHDQSPHRLCSFFGETFGTIYDVSTVIILAFAGASAMAGLLNLIPRYLPRYGMAPEWARAVRPMVVLFTGINLLVTWVFNADVSAQGGAYATGVLVLMSSACIATVIDKTQRAGTGSLVHRLPWTYVAIATVFIYTTATNMIERPDGIQIAAFFIVAILGSSIFSRVWRATELRFRGFEFVDCQSKFLWESMKYLEFPVLVPHRPGGRDLEQKEKSIRELHRLTPDVPIVFTEAVLGDPSEFEQMPLIEITQTGERFVVRVTRCASIAHVIAALALDLSAVGRPPEIHFGWSNETPMAASFGFLLFGEGNIPWMVSELMRKAQPDDSRRPRVIIG